MARMMGRVGPMVAGPAGILQPIADFFKLLYKEEIVPAFADKTVFRFAPGLFFLAPLLMMLFVPVTGSNAVAGFPSDLLLIVFLLAFATFVISVLSYSSASSFTTVASGRLVLQYVSYEIPLVIAIMTPALWAGSLSVEGIVQAQSSTYWNVFLMPISLIVFIIALLAELEKPPFDIPSAKTEIVAGWLTEFSGRALAFLKLSKEVSLVFGVSLATALFLGGPLGPAPIPFLSGVFYTAYFLIKVFALAFIVFIIRTALARLRIIDATVVFWKLLLPLSLVQLFLVLLVKGGL